MYKSNIDIQEQVEDNSVLDISQKDISTSKIAKNVS